MAKRRPFFTFQGIQSVLVNPNIATVQTAEGLADKVRKWDML